MSQYKDIPQPTDQRNVSQGDILTNYRYLSTPINVAAGIPPGILPVDHLASGDNVANPTDGFHKQVSMLNVTSPGSLVNAINGQTAGTITYTNNDGNSNGQLRMLNSLIDSPVTYLKAMCQFNAAGALIGNNFNVSSVVLNSSGFFTVNFTVNMPSTNYLVLMSGLSTSGNRAFSFSYTAKLVSSVGINIFNSTISTLPRANPDETSIMIIGLF